MPRSTRFGYREIQQMHRCLRSFCALTELANRYGSDKGTEIGAQHAYTLVYAPMFEGFRKRPTEVLESVEAGLGIAAPPSRRSKLQLLAALLRPGVPAQLQIGLCRGVQGLIMLRRTVRRRLVAQFS